MQLSDMHLSGVHCNNNNVALWHTTQLDPQGQGLDPQCTSPVSVVLQLRLVSG